MRTILTNTYSKCFKSTLNSACHIAKCSLLAVMNNIINAHEQIFLKAQNNHSLARPGVHFLIGLLPIISPYEQKKISLIHLFI